MKMNAKHYSLYAAICAGLLLGACANVKSQTQREAPVTKPYIAYQIQDKSSDQVPQLSRSQFQHFLDHYLKRYGYQSGEGLTINYEIQYYDKGNRALRYLVGFGAGKAEVDIQTTVLDENGKQLLQINTDSNLKMGIFGGSSHKVMINAAKDIAKHIARSGVLEKQKSHKSK